MRKPIRRVGLPAPARPSGVTFAGPRPATVPAPAHREALGATPWARPAQNAHQLVRTAGNLSGRPVGGG